MALSEEDTKTRYITPAIVKAGWNVEQFSMEYGFKEKRQIYEFSAGRILFDKDSSAKQRVLRAKPKKADYLLFYSKTKLPLAIIEAKAYDKHISEGLEQAKSYAKALKVKFAYSSNGKLPKNQRIYGRRSF